MSKRTNLNSKKENDRKHTHTLSKSVTLVSTALQGPSNMAAPLIQWPCVVQTPRKSFKGQKMLPNNRTIQKSNSNDELSSIVGTYTIPLKYSPV